MVDNQHKKITGYRELTQRDIEMINEAKEVARLCGLLIDKLAEAPGVDHRMLALGKTNLQTGFMWTVRSVAQPGTFG